MSEFVKFDNLTVRTFQLEDHISEFLSSEHNDYQMNEVKKWQQTAYSKTSVLQIKIKSNI